MNTKQALSCAAFVAIATAALCGYIESRIYTFTQNGQTFEQVGVMAQAIDGQTLYIPVFRRVQ
jgi:hypothetical protein